MHQQPHSSPCNRSQCDLRQCASVRRKSTARTRRIGLTLGHHLDRMLAPAPIALVGASPTPNASGGDMVRELRSAHCEGDVFPVSPRYGSGEGFDRLSRRRPNWRCSRVGPRDVERCSIRSRSPDRRRTSLPSPQPWSGSPSSQPISAISSTKSTSTACRDTERVRRTHHPNGQDVGRPSHRSAP